MRPFPPAISRDTDSNARFLQEIWRRESTMRGTSEVRRTVTVMVIDPRTGLQTRAASNTKYYPVGPGGLVEEIFEEYASEELIVAAKPGTRPMQTPDRNTSSVPLCSVRLCSVRVVQSGFVQSGLRNRQAFRSAVRIQRSARRLINSATWHQQVLEMFSRLMCTARRDPLCRRASGVRPEHVASQERCGGPKNLSAWHTPAPEGQPRPTQRGGRPAPTGTHAHPTPAFRGGNT